ncbi:MAG: hypothetical protein H6819_00730 [Phycisphaerales bacterium]|nr:hypothetical protein [Phycisphaerales bacterium]MCB9857267.1 hypothetical protein [Phycisphaerales bacterium]MCB9863019.1 hypothetical protein [Phycisphaerales bacterium]
MNTNPLDILELISRGDADPLTREERVIVDRAIAADPGLARQRAAYVRLDALLARFAMLPNDVDWESLSGDITAEIRAEADAAVAMDDDSNALIETLSRPLPPVDWSAFHTRVATAVRDEAAQLERERTIKWPAIFKWAPLAAAALIAVFVWGPFGIPAKNGGSNVSPIHVNEPVALVEVELAAPTSTGSVAVSFDETPADDSPQDPTVMAGGTVIVNGSWPTEESATVIDVDTYYY